MGRRQKGKHLKRRKSWHRGRGTGRQFAAADRRLEKARRRARRQPTADREPDL